MLKKGKPIKKSFLGDNINQILQHNKTQLEAHSTIILKMIVRNKRREVRVFDKQGAFFSPGYFYNIKLEG